MKTKFLLFSSITTLGWLGSLTLWLFVPIAILLIIILCGHEGVVGIGRGLGQFDYEEYPEGSVERRAVIIMATYVGTTIFFSVQHYFGLLIALMCVVAICLAVITAFLLFVGIGMAKAMSFTPAERRHYQADCMDPTLFDKQSTRKLGT